MSKGLLSGVLGALGAVLHSPEGTAAVVGGISLIPGIGPILGLVLGHGVAAMLDVAPDLGATFTDEDVKAALLAKGHKVLPFRTSALFA